MTQKRLFNEGETVKREGRASYLKEVARTSAESYWSHSLSGFDRHRIQVQGEDVGFLHRAECERCGAEVYVRPRKSALPYIEGPAVSRECDSPPD